MPTNWITISHEHLDSIIYRAMLAKDPQNPPSPEEVKVIFYDALAEIVELQATYGVPK